VSAGLSLRDVSVELGGASILDGVSIEVEPGSWVGLIGPNGAGKTTVLRCASGSVPFDGTVRIGGSDLSSMDVAQVARSVAVVPQHPTLPEGMRVVDYVLLGRTPHRGPMSSESRHDLAVVAEVLEALDLAALADREVATLSGGELQRAVIARALAQETPILLLDEPTTALDIGRQQEVMELVDHLRHQRELTVLSAMHDLTIAGQFTDRLVLVSGGRVVAEGPATEVLTPAMIADHYGAAARVVKDGTGGVVVIPLRSGVDEALHEPADGKADPAADEADQEILDP
jgi:iron complex transport system ATP-binding protein